MKKYVELTTIEAISIDGGSELSDALVYGAGWVVGYVESTWNIISASNPFEGRRW